MHTYSKTKQKHDILIGMIAFAVVAVLVTGLVFAIRYKPEIMDQNQVAGVPGELPEKNAYTSYSAAGVATVSLCCAPSYDGKNAELYITNPAENKVLLKAELYTVKAVENGSNGEITFLPDQLIGETGYIRPGNYVRQVCLKNVPKDRNSKIMIKICTRIEESGQSNGFFYIRTAV